MIEVLTPKSREEWLHLRKDTIGASEVAAVLGVHPYMTPFKLWALKSGKWGNDETKAMRRGRMLEDDCIEILREERPEWTVTPNVIGHGSKFYRDVDAGLSATPDALIQKRCFAPQDASQFGICQIKTVNEHTFRKDWADNNGSIQVPTYVAIQAIQEADLTGASWACVAAFVGMDLEPHIMDVELHVGMMGKIRRRVPEFLRRVRDNDPPPVDYARDAETIRAQYAEDDGGEVDLSGNERVQSLLTQRGGFAHLEKQGDAAREWRAGVDAELIHILGNATRGNLGDGRYIEAATVRKKECVHKATTFRTVKIKQRREK